MSEVESLFYNPAIHFEDIPADLSFYQHLKINYNFSKLNVLKLTIKVWQGMAN